MSTVVKRGFCQEDPKEFGSDAIDKLQKAGRDVRYLLNQGYPVKSATTFVGNHYLLSESLLLKCMDGTVRDLAALRGTYRLIDKTDGAIQMIGRKLAEYKVGKTVFYLDAPVSNSGRLKGRILKLLAEYDFEVQVEVINQVDSALEKLDNVITGDAIILDKCISWINMNRQIIDDYIGEYPYVDFESVQEEYFRQNFRIY